MWLSIKFFDYIRFQIVLNYLIQSLTLTIDLRVMCSQHMSFDDLDLADFMPEFGGYMGVFIDDNVSRHFKTALNVLKKQLHKINSS